MFTCLLAFVLTNFPVNCPPKSACASGISAPVAVSIGLRANIISSGTSIVTYAEVLEGSKIYKVETTIAYSGMENARSVRQTFLVVDNRGYNTEIALIVDENDGNLSVGKLRHVNVFKWSPVREALAVNTFNIKQQAIKANMIATKR